MTAPAPPVRRCAVLGSPIAHSLSPVLHRAGYAALGLTGWRYDRFEVDEADLPGFLDGCGSEWVGLSLTMPLKRAVIPLLEEVSPLAARVGAVNTVVFADPVARDGAVHSDGNVAPRRVRRGSNTDVAGVVGALSDAGIRPARPGRETDGPAVVLGGGATAASAVAALADLGWTAVRLAVRSAARADDVVEVGARFGVTVEVCALDRAAPLVAEATVTVATVPGGVLGDLADRLVVADPAAVLLDAIYDPWPTPLAAAWAAAGGVVVSGLDMLIHQALDQVQAMTGLRPPVAVLRAAVSAGERS